jgi:hypothetical protein
MRKWLILLSALSVTAASGAPAWTWVDSEGTVHYSDRPVPGARQIELGGAQGFGAPARPASLQPASSTATPPPSEQGAPQAYRSVTIVSPAEQETLWNIGAMLNVRVQLDPPLQAGHRIDLVYDGQRRNLNTASTQVTLPDVFRGAHTLQVVVLDDAGAEITRSPPRTFFVQQTSVQNPNSIAGRQRATSNGQ